MRLKTFDRIFALADDCILKHYFKLENIPMEKVWKEKLISEIKKPYMQHLQAFLEKEHQEGKIIYPPKDQIFASFLNTPFNDVKVVLIGQDPYHGPNQAHGLSFSVAKGVKPPPSLINIYKELYNDLGVPIASHGCLLKWAEQGVLLLNASLTVRAGEPKSHHGKGWEEFTDFVVSLLFQRKDPIVFILWGKSAQEKCQKFLFEKSPHLVLAAAHPSPYSAYSGFFGCRHFSKANDFLQKVGKTPVDWHL